MVKVGMQKQAQYDQGIQKIQSEIDNIAGLDVSRDLDKNYLQTKLNDLGDKLTFYAAGDFSNFQLQNSVSGMTKQLVKDPVIQNAVSSTGWARKQKEKIEKAKSDGTWSIENEDLYNEQYSKWLNGTEPGEKFSSEYIPYRDVYKKLREIAKDVGVDESLVQNLFNPDGSVNKVMIETYSKGRDPNKIYEAFMTGLDQSDYRQLAITGRYKYKGYGNEDLIGVLQKSNDEYKEVSNARKLDFQQKIKLIDNAVLSTKNPEEKKQLEEQKTKIIQAISKIDEQINDSEKSFNQSKASLGSGDVDFANSVRARIHTNNFLSTLSRDFADKNSYVKYSESPLWKANFEEDKFNFDKWYKRENLKIEKRKASAAEKANKIKEDEILMYSTAGGLGGGTPATPENVETAYTGLINDRKNAYLILARSLFPNDPKGLESYIESAMKTKVKDPETKEMRNQTRDEVIQGMAVQEYTRIASVLNDKTGKYGKSPNLSPVLVETAMKLSKLNPMISSMKASMEQIEKDVISSSPDLIDEQKIIKGLKPTTIKVMGTNVTLSIQDQVDLINVLKERNSIFSSKSEEEKSEKSWARLEAKYEAAVPGSSRLILNYAEAQSASMPTWTKRFLGGSPIAAAYDLFTGTDPGEMTPFQKAISLYNSNEYESYQRQIDKRYNEVFSGFFPENSGFVMNDKNRPPVIAKLNASLYNNPLYTEEARKALFENGSQLVFTSTPSTIGFGGTSHAVVVIGKDGKQFDPIEISEDHYTLLSGKPAPRVDTELNLIRAKVNGSPDGSTNSEGLGNWQTSLVPGTMFSNIRNYNIGGMDLHRSTENPNLFYPILYVAPSGSSDYSQVPIQMGVTLSEGMALPQTLTDAQLRAKGVNF
jgi:hypothetical protein